MNYDEFTEELKKSILDELQSIGFDDNVKFKVNDTIKNNDIIIKKLSIIPQNSESIGIDYPITSVYEEYKLGTPIAYIAGEIVSSFKKAMRELPKNYNDINDFDKIQFDIVIQLVNYEMNKERLKNLPHIKILDLAVIFRWVVKSDDEGTYSTVITNDTIQDWEMTAGELYAIAIKNSAIKYPYSLTELFDSIIRALDITDEEILKLCKDLDENHTLYMLTNSTNHYGASTILYPTLLKTLAEERDSDILILPASVHEVMLLFPGDVNILSYDEWKELVAEANRYSVGLIDLLSDNIYKYTREKDKIEIIEV